jgi:hypothetical protein
MKVRDSHVVVCPGGSGDSGYDDNPKVIESRGNVTRWHEVLDCVSFHSYMASKCWIRTKMWLVNADDKDGHKFSLCCASPEDVPDEMSRLKSALKLATLAQDQCPLTAQVHEIGREISNVLPALVAHDQKATVVICTQGLPMDGRAISTRSAQLEFWSELKELSKLPVKIIIRLCTDTKVVSNAYKKMHRRIESMDVLDDYWGEAMEIHLHNPWLTYGIGMHRLREAGLLPEIFGYLDQRPLTLDDLHEFCETFFIGDDGCIDLPHPMEQSWNCFFRAVKVLIEKEKRQWNPVKKKMMPWIDLDRLEAIHDAGKDGMNQRRPLKHNTKNVWQTDPHSYSRRNRPTSNRDVPDPPSDNRKKQTPLGIPPGLQGPCCSHRLSTSPSSPKSFAIKHFLLTIPLMLPPNNTTVEPHEYFTKWKILDSEAFVGVSEDVQIELLVRAMRKLKIFLHPDKLPKDLTQNQTQLFETLWNELQEKEALLQK